MTLNKGYFTELFFLKKIAEKIDSGTQFKIIDRLLTKELLTEDSSLVNLLTILEDESKIAFKENKS